MIHALHEALAQGTGAPVGLLLHLGAGSGEALTTLAAQQPQRLVLVEGDPRHAAALQLRVQTLGLERAEVMGVAVSARGGLLDWRRFSLPALDGPVDRGALRSVYPRLRQLEQTQVASLPLADLLHQVLESHSDVPGPRLLLLDLPGQEGSLLGALPPNALASFDTVLVCGAGEPGQREGQPPGSSALPAQGLRLGWSNHAQEPLWPLALWLQTAAQRTTARAPMPGTDSVAARQELVALQAAVAKAEATHRDTVRELQEHLRQERLRHDALAQQLAEAEAQIGMLKDLLLREGAP